MYTCVIHVTYLYVQIFVINKGYWNFMAQLIYNMHTNRLIHVYHKPLHIETGVMALKIYNSK